MRHLCSFALVEISLLSYGAVGAPCRGGLIASSSSSDRCSPGGLRACTVAIPITVVTPAAQAELQPAAAADDEAQVVHGAGRDRQKLGRIPEPCDEGFVARPAQGYDRRLECGTRAFTFLVAGTRVVPLTEYVGEFLAAARRLHATGPQPLRRPVLPPEPGMALSGSLACGPLLDSARWSTTARTDVLQEKGGGPGHR